MSNSGSNTLLNFVDVDDLLETLAEDDGIDAAIAAAAAVEARSFSDADNEQSSSPSKEDGDTRAPAQSSDETHQQRQEQDEVKGADTEREEKAGSPGGRHVVVDVDDTPLDKQLGLERFRALEKQRAEQKEQLRLEEKEVEKAKAAYVGKKWVVKQPAGPLRPQEAGELAVACAIKCGGKKSPREEIEELTRQEKEKKEQQKALAAAAHPPLYLPVKVPLPLMKKEGIPGADGAAGEEGDETGGGAKNKVTGAEVALQEDAGMKEADENGEEKSKDDEHREENTCENDIPDGQSSSHETGSTLGQPNTTPKTLFHEKNEEEAHAGGKNAETKVKTKEKVPIFTCFSRRGNVREPHKTRINKPTDIGMPANTRSTGDLVVTPKEEQKGEEDEQNEEKDEEKGEKDERKGEKDEREGEGHTGETYSTALVAPIGSVFGD